jgi:hypothetical protein
MDLVVINTIQVLELVVSEDGNNIELVVSGFAPTGGGGGGAVDSVNGQTGVVVLDKSDIGLGNVDNTSDANKPVSTAQQTALDGKENSLGFTPENVANKQTDLTASATKYPTVNAVNTGLSGKQDSLGFTPENVANKSTDTNLGTSDTLYPSQKAVKTYVDNNIGPGGSGKIYTTLTIGASDALDTDSTKYDYFCDGTADQVEILAAIAALPSTGGRIILSEGTFNIAAVIAIAKDSIVLEGNGQATKLFLVNATNANVITIGNGATAYVNITVKNLFINGNKANQTTNGHGVRVEAGAANTIIENVRILNTFKDNINGQSGVVGAKIINNYLDTTGASSYNIHWSGTKCICDNNYCASATSANIYFDGSTQPSGNIISNNICTLSGGQGILASSWQAVVSGNHVSEFTFEGISSNVPCNITGNSVYQRNGTGNLGIYIFSSDPNQCTANTIFVYDNVSFVFTGIYCTAASSTITGNNIQYESSASPAHKGILLGADKISCTGNSITQYQFTGTGIVRSGNPNHLTITGNMITGFNNGIDITGVTYGICDGNAIRCNFGIIATDSNQCIISNNSIYTNTATGSQIAIYANNASTCTITITGNSIERSGVEVIYLAKVTKSIISNNRIFNGGRNISSAGILLTGTSTYNTIAGNTIYTSSGSYTYGIREAAAADGPNTITGNILLNWSTAAIGDQNSGTQVGLNITS